MRRYKGLRPAESDLKLLGAKSSAKKDTTLTGMQSVLKL